MGINVAIVGSGPAGCMLAHLLLHKDSDISVTIFERESSIDFRSQGGTLDLHEKTGQAALKEAGLFDEFLKYARYDGEAFKIADKNLLCYITQQGSKGSSTTGRPEIDRPKLRELLFNSLPEGTVRWNKKLVAVSGDHSLSFADGSTASGFDLVVGADGAWSKVRPLLSDAKPYYSGIAGHSLLISNAEQQVPDLHKLVNRGNLFSFSDGKSIMAQQMGDGSINVGTWAVRPSDWQSACNVHDTEEVKKTIRQEYAGWHPDLLALTQAAEGTVQPRDLYMLPIGHKWKHRAGVTLIGDAAHVMTPFAGEGVNLALQDAMKLAAAIKSSHSSSNLDGNIEAFERDMFSRATETQQLTYDMMTAMFFTPGAPRQGIERYILRAVRGELGPWITALLTPVVYVWFFIFKLIW
ncbi:hypothetical protein CKM354_000402400 [Cercospora kikuchii]|uniref:FAD-binding domain-containing protein n=1 Tax=Cercospora kikuchii TaxID=84275 RepID=A0A9P3FAX5_9PEZI|nr:uncharacterized protein CKM354_000402400 [Cercospora kikuchii]GIZ40696.1 hypothetical protein CKM354_000402400 [Cercospora kikuchii]